MIAFLEPWSNPISVSDISMCQDWNCNHQMVSSEGGGGELGVFRVREHPLSAQVHPLTARSTPS